MKTQFVFLLWGALTLVSGAGVPRLPDGKAVKAVAEKAQSIRSMPRIEGSRIVCGNKSLSLDLDGKIKISADGIAVGDLFCYYSVMRKKDQKVWWGGFDKKVSSLKRKGDTFEMTLCRQVANHTWKGAEQKVSITPEGLIKVEFTYLKFDHPELTLRDKTGSLWFMLNNKAASGAKHTINGSVFTVPEKGAYKLDHSDTKNYHITFFADDPARQFKLLCDKSGMYHVMAHTYPAQNQSRFTYRLHPGKKGVIYIDLRQGVSVQKSNELRGGIDFKKIENMELPDGSRRNLLPNSSFERGLECFRLRHSNTNYRWGWKPWHVQSKEKYAGSNALEFDALRAKQYPGDDFRRLNCTHNLTTATLILEPGTYTFSLYAKCTSGEKGLVNVWIPNYFSGSIYSTNDRSHIGRLPVSDRWRRQSYTFKLDRLRPVEFHINAACLGKGDCKVWIDALQLEKGNKPTAYDAPAAEGRLVTSEKENFVNASEKINGRLLITTVKKGMKGTVSVRVKNFFGEVLLNRKFDFKTDAEGSAAVALPLDALPGRGVFMVRADYVLADGSTSFDLHRYARVAYLDNTNPLSRIFGIHYNKPEVSSDYPSVLERWQRLGVGSRFFRYSYDKKIVDLENKYNLSPGLGYLFSYTRDGARRFAGFAVADMDKHEAYLSLDDPRILIRDYKADANGFPTPEYLEKFKNAVARVVAKYPHITMWIPEGEQMARFPVEWWSKEGTPRKSAQIRAMLLKAFAAGVRKGNPKALTFQDAPCNMRPQGGIAETDLLLEEANKIGARVDGIGIHPYRNKPENPDLDSDTALLLKVLDKHNYSKAPIVWSEMMHWGPYSIPQLDVDFQRFGGGVAWYGGFLSYDMGKHEKISASFYARSWLVALKYADRIIGATAGSHHNNCFMDVMKTPYAAQLIPNTLNNLLGNSTFKSDIRFAPYIRTYLFEDAKKRPVAVLWCYREQVDDGSADAPVVEADFGKSLEGVFDLMNSPRAFTSGKFRFPVSGFPVFLRGRPGTLAHFQKALQRAAVISGEGIAPVNALVKPVTPDSVQVTLSNFLGTPFKGSLNGRKITIPASGVLQLTLPNAGKITSDNIALQQIPLHLQGDNGSSFKFPQNFEAFSAKRVAENATLENMDWNKLPKLPLTRKWKKPESSGFFQLGWNARGLFVKAEIKDSKFVHTEYKDPGARWKNDCVQISFDTLGDARSKRPGRDENDSDYAIFPNAKGDKASFFVFRPVEQQLGLGAQSPRNFSFMPQVPCRFNCRNGVLTYQAFIPAMYLLPAKLQKGYCFGFGMFVPESSKADTVNGALTLASDGGPTSNRPHLWPLVLLDE